MSHPDLIVIGGGAAGLVTSAGAAGIGARVTLIEQARLGGECLWNGCVPSKALIAAARAAHDGRQASRFGIDVDDVRVDFGRVLAWVREAQRRIAPHDSPERFRDLGVEVVQGTARFVGERALQVDGRALQAKRIVIATGSRPAVPPIDGLAAVPYLTNETIFSLDRQPDTLLVLGAGPIGLELAQAFARLGTHVRVIEAAPQLLPREDSEIAELLGKRLASEGVEIHLDTTVVRAAAEAGRVCLHAVRGRTERVPVTFDGDALLVATGRSSNVAGLEPAAAGVDTTATGVVVDDRLRTTASGIWAAGDVTGGPRFTHVADYQARTVIRNAFFPFASKVSYAHVPWVTYTEPELAHVGLTEQAARDRHGDRVRVWRRPFADVDRAITDDVPEGMVKIVTDHRGRILGAHILGHGAGNLIAEIVLAMKHDLAAGALGSTVHAYPTMAEAVKQAAEQYTKSRFTGTARAVARWFARR